MPQGSEDARRSRRVLVVDDDPDNLEWLTILLEGAGHRVKTARDGRSGIDVALSFLPDVVVCDIRMPDVNGLQFVVAWESYGQDGSGRGVFGQRYDFGHGAITVVSPNTNVKWRIGSLQKIQWMHNLDADAPFRIELDRDDDGDGPRAPAGALSPMVGACQLRAARDVGLRRFSAPQASRARPCPLGAARST